MNKEVSEKKIRGLLLLFCIIAAVLLVLVISWKKEVPDYIGRELTAHEEQEILEENSPFTEYVRLSPNADFPRTDKIRKITIHHMAGNYSLEQVGRTFSFKDREASSNYAIDSNGRTGLYVEEGNRSWASQNEENDQQAVTIEVANDEEGGKWHVSDRAFRKLIRLCTDICRRNGITELVYTGDAEGNLTFHKMFSEDTECPGPYLESRAEDIVRLVNENLNKK